MSKSIPQQLINEKIQFIEDYKNSKNAASGSKDDSNANVEQKNMVTLSAEIDKDIKMQTNIEIMRRKIVELFGEQIGESFLNDLHNHTLYLHDSTSLMPYCVSLSMYPFLYKGTKSIGGRSHAPKHIHSFCGSFINLITNIAGQFAGAVATVEFLMYFDYFATLSFGEDYLESHKNKKEIYRYFKQVVYTLNEPATARGGQSIFWNISIYDKYYFESLFGTFIFPDGKRPNYDSISKLQKEFMAWFRNERKRELLTFPVVTSAMLIEDGSPKDKDFQNFNAKELSLGNSFFVYQSTSVDSLASCCFKGDEEILINENNIEKKYKLKDFVGLFGNEDEFENKIESGKYKIISYNLKEEKIETNIIGVLKKKNNTNKLIKINVNNNIINVTTDHILMVKDKISGEIKEISAIDFFNNKDRYLLPKC